MGQAKQRKAEIDALKAQKPREYGILAIRHTEDGQREFVYFAADYNKPKNDKNALLRHICLKDWAHKPPAGLIAEYLWQTTSFNMFGDNPNIGAFIMNFYELDEEMTAKTGEKRYSCRLVSGGTAEYVKDYAYKLSKELSDSGDYSVKHNHYA